MEDFKRILNKDKGIFYEGELYDYADNYHTFFPCKNKSIGFHFIGSKLRIICATDTNGNYGKAKINIDNIIKSEFDTNKERSEACVVYEQNDLEFKEHFVTITGLDDKYLIFYALDIDQNGKITKYTPPIPKIGKEAKYKIISLNASSGSGGTVDNCGLFDNKVFSSWNTPDMFYWYDKNDYIEIQLFNKCNIWRHSCDWHDRFGELQILQKQSDNSYVDVTNKYSVLTSNIKNEWEMFAKNLPIGIYKFVGGYEKRDNSAYRLDDEWYIERIKECKYLLKQDNKYYNIKSEFYDKQKKVYLPCERDFEKNGIDDLSQLVEEKSIEIEKGKKIEIDEGSLFEFNLNNNIDNIISID